MTGPSARAANRTPIRRICLASVLLGLLAACSVSADREPRDVLDEERPSAANTTIAVSPEPGTGSTVYFLGPPGAASASPLVPVGRAAQDEPTTLITTLFEGPTTREQELLGVRTAVPVGTRLLSAQLDSQGTLLLDVSAEFLSSAGDVLLDAVVQVVYTAAQIPGERRVRLLVEGEPQDWPTSAGTTTRDPLSVYDFPARLPVVTAAPAIGTTDTPAATGS
jgi:hypothetical protein